jgi:hypothetical protein
LNIHPDTFSKEEFLQFREKSLWQLIWELTLWSIVFRLMKEPIPAKLEKIIGDAQQVSTVLTRLLNHRRKIESYREFVTDFQDKRGRIQSGVAIFIDDVDQTIHDFLKNPHHSDDYYEGKESPSVAVWVNAQLGLMGAIYNINRQNSHIKIYSTIRREAFEALESEMKINYLQHSSILKYEKDDIKVIFEKNIQLVEPADLINKNADSFIGRFLGFDSLPHRFAIDTQGERRIEKVFDFIYRHTYGRPREIVIMGQQLHQLVTSTAYKNSNLADRIEKVKVLVNKQSNELFRQYKREIIPYLNETKLAQFLASIRSNVIIKEDLLRLNVDTIMEYFNLGLIGHARLANHSGQMKQVFNPPATYNYRTREPLPDTGYLLIHSTMDNLLINQRSYGNFYNKYNIIGDEYEFYPKVDNYIQPITHYLPKDLSGNRFKSPNESAGHGFPLEDIYNHFFQFDESPKYHEKLTLEWENANHILALLGRICYCYLLEKQFSNAYFKNKKEEFLTELNNHQIGRMYNAALPDASSNNALDRFLDKLFGRFITLGCYLVLDMRIEWIHELMIHGKFNFIVKSNKDTAFSYLSRSFFISELIKEEPRDPKNHQHLRQKQRIFNNLSTYEQDSLKIFVKNATDEVNYLGWIEDENHKNWLKANALDLLWRPDL